MAQKNLRVWIQWGSKGLPMLKGGLKGLKTNLREAALEAQALNVQLKRADGGLKTMQQSIAMVGVAGAQDKCHNRGGSPSLPWSQTPWVSYPACCSAMP